MTVAYGWRPLRQCPSREAPASSPWAWVRWGCGAGGAAGNRHKIQNTRLRAIVAQVIQSLVIDGKSNRFPALVTSDLNQENCVIILARPTRNLCHVTAMGLEHIFGKMVQILMLPGDINGGVSVGLFLKLLFKLLDLSVAELGVDGEAATDGRRLNRRQGTNIIVSIVVDLVGGIGRKDKLRRRIPGQQNFGQRQGAVETATSQLPKASDRLFGMPNTDQSFYRWLGRVRRWNRSCLSVHQSGSRESKTKKDQQFFHNSAVF